MTTELTNEWVSNVLGSFAFGRRQLAWVSYEFHMEDSVIKSLSAKKVDAVIVTGRCTSIFIHLMFCGINHLNPLVQRNMTIGWAMLESTAKLLLRSFVQFRMCMNDDKRSRSAAVVCMYAVYYLIIT